jgi:hypothetical protein
MLLTLRGLRRAEWCTLLSGSITNEMTVTDSSRYIHCTYFISYMSKRLKDSDLEDYVRYEAVPQMDGKVAIVIM